MQRDLNSRNPETKQYKTIRLIDQLILTNSQHNFTSWGCGAQATHPASE
jgi:hypothetical protein